MNIRQLLTMESVNFTFSSTLFFFIFVVNLVPNTIAELPASQLDEVESVNLHNEKRANVSPAAVKCLHKLKWDDNLARLAQAWTNGCKFEHGQVDERANTMAPDGKPYGNRMGQNLAWSSGKLTIQQSVYRWDKEKDDYDFCANKKKDPSKMIGHYTAIVWMETTHVGCGWADCAGVGQIITCNYWPAGNMNMGTCRPYLSKKCGGETRGLCTGVSGWKADPDAEQTCDASKGLDEGNGNGNGNSNGNGDCLKWNAVLMLMKLVMVMLVAM